ncbi:MAG: OmpH family outer membrane protein [Acidobacteria bacterium]|nr:OmpH family outer membrane protein [Acidobacteriota bacterium]
MLRTSHMFCATWIVATALLVAQSTAPPASAQAQQNAAAPAPTKFGFIETLRIVYETDEGKTEIEKVQEFINKKQSEYDAKKSDLDKLSEQYQNQQRSLNPETREEMEKTIQTKDKELKRFQEDTQVEIDRQRDGILAKLGQKVQSLIDDYARENGYAAVFVRAQTQAYVAPGLDITDEIIKRYNQKYPAQKPAAATKQ